MRNRPLSSKDKKKRHGKNKLHRISKHNYIRVPKKNLDENKLVILDNKKIEKIELVRDAIVDHKKEIIKKFLKKQSETAEHISCMNIKSMTVYEVIALFKTISDYIEKNFDIINDNNEDRELEISDSSVVNVERYKFDFEDREKLRDILDKLYSENDVELNEEEGKLLDMLLKYYTSNQDNFELNNMQRKIIEDVIQKVEKIRNKK